MSSPNKVAEKEYLGQTAQTKARAHAKVETYQKDVFTPQPINPIIHQNQRSARVTNRVLLGYNRKGGQVKPSLGQDYAFAVEFKDQWNRANQSNDATGAEILHDVSRHEIRWALTLLERTGGNLREAIKFFKDHGCPEMGTKTVFESMKIYMAHQQEKNLSNSSASEKHPAFITYYRPMVDFFWKQEAD